MLYFLISEWSSITGRGGGGASEVLPLQKGGGAGKVWAILKGGGGGTQQVLW